jgi:hypothetical protein
VIAVTGAGRSGGKTTVATALAAALARRACAPCWWTPTWAYAARRRASAASRPGPVRGPRGHPWARPSTRRRGTVSSPCPRDVRRTARRALPRARRHAARGPARAVRRRGGRRGRGGLGPRRLVAAVADETIVVVGAGQPKASSRRAPAARPLCRRTRPLHVPRRAAGRPGPRARGLPPFFLPPRHPRPSGARLMPPAPSSSTTTPPPSPSSATSCSRPAPASSSRPAPRPTSPARPATSTSSTTTSRGARRRRRCSRRSGDGPDALVLCVVGPPRGRHAQAARERRLRRPSRSRTARRPRRRSASSPRAWLRWRGDAGDAGGRSERPFTR